MAFSKRKPNLPAPAPSSTTYTGSDGSKRRRGSALAATSCMYAVSNFAYVRAM
jgi:hypothetical protein